MAKNVKINGVTYENVPQVEIPLSAGSGNAIFYDTSAANAAAGDILTGKSAFGASGAVNGSMTNNGAINESISAKATQVAIPAGYHNVSEYASAVVNVNVNMCGLTVKINDPHASSFMSLSDSHAYYYTQVNKHAEKQTVTLNGSPYVTAAVYLPNDGSGKCSGFFEVAVSARTGGYGFDAVNIQLTPPNSSTFTDLTDMDHNTNGYVAYRYDGDAQVVHYLFHLHDVTLGSEILIQPKIL